MRRFSVNRRLASLGVLGVLVLGLALSTVSCSSRPSYGVVLWSKNEASVKTGEIVRIRSQSQLSSTYLIALPHGKGNLEIDNWRVSPFRHERDAINFAAAYAPYVTETARSRSAGIVLYQSPSLTAQRVYRMRANQEVKVISRENLPGSSGAEGTTWYEVLTGDGVLGYCQNFDLVLGRGETAGSQGSSIDAALSQTFRPASFQNMIDTGRIDLAKFAPEFGFFPDPSTHSFRIVTPKLSASYRYSAIKDLGENQYAFVGTPVQMSLLSPSQIQLHYLGPEGKQVSEQYIAMSNDEVKLAIEKEHNRRLLLYGSFLDKGSFRSNYYGRISFSSEMTFSWTGFSRLQPDVIPAEVSGEGTVDFPLFLSDALSASYDGVITFRFGGSSGRSAVSFLYAFRNGGLQLTYAPPSTVTDGVVAEVGPSPIIIYFSYSR